jgi:hypothetical protein
LENPAAPLPLHRLPGKFPAMKTLGIILSVLLVILVLLGVGLQMFLTKGLTTALNQGVFPAVKGMYGLDMSITNASVNLLKGTAELDGFAVRNLKGYEEPTLLTFDQCLLKVDMLSLLKRDPIVIETAEAKGVELTVELKNGGEQFNVLELAEAVRPLESTQPMVRSGNKDQTLAPPTELSSSEKSTEPTTPTETIHPSAPIPVHIRRMAANGMLRIVMDAKKEQIYPLDLRLTGSDLFTVPAEGQPESLLVLRGSLAHNKDAYVTDLSAILEPLTDPQNPSFNATGSILDIDASFLGDLLEKNNMQSSSFSIKPSITCTKGQLKGSYIDLVLNDLKIYQAEVDSFSIRIPIKGTIQKPAPELPDLQKLLLSELSKQLGTGTNTAPRELLISGLTNNVKELQDSPALQDLIQQIIPGSQTNAATTNESLGEAIGNALSEQLDKNLKDEAVKESIKSLSESLFGN